MQGDSLWRTSVRRHFAYQREWKTLAEPEGVGTCDDQDTFQTDIAKASIENKGARVSGRGGVGKTELIKQLVALFEEDYKGRIEILAATHVQAANAQGKPILSHLHRNSRCKERVLIIDEMSMCTLSI